MLYKTHKVIGALFGAIAFNSMYKNGMLSTDLNPFIQLAIMYPACSWGSTAPDLDHAPDCIKEQTPINLFINKLLHIKSCQHRSWQTHSIWVTLTFCILLMVSAGLLGGLGLSMLDITILRLIIVGLSIGIVSHLFADMLSMAGIHLIPGIMIRLVPKNKFFGTGTPWEKGVMVTAYTLLGVYLIYLVISYFHILN